MSRMFVIALGQQKGGVGKSTVAIHLSALAALSGKTALIDMDSDQGTSSKWGAKRRAKDAQKGPTVIEAEASTLEATLKGLRGQGYARVFIDLPGRNAVATNLAIKLADFVLIPARPLDIDLEAAIPTVQACLRAKTPYALLMNICQSQTNCKRATRVAETLSEKRIEVCPAYIIQRIGVPDAIAGGLVVNETLPASPSSKEFQGLIDWIESRLGV